jgi:hypothetical protein
MVHCRSGTVVELCRLYLFCSHNSSRKNAAQLLLLLLLCVIMKSARHDVMSHSCTVQEATGHKRHQETSFACTVVFWT